MLLGQVECFVEVARSGNVTRAAHALGVTQPALTMRLKALERELGSSLFVRLSHGVRLTAAGRAFLPYAQRVVEAIAQGNEVMEDVREGRAGKLRLGAAPAASTYVLPEVLKRLHTTHPGVKISVRTDHSEEVLQMVLRDEVELGLTRELRHPAVQSISLYEEELILVVAPTHRFARQGRIRLDDIGEEQLIMFDRTSSYHEQTNALFRQAGVLVRDAMELDNIDAAKKMVEQDLGIALLPRTAVAAELRAETLRSVRISDVAPLRRHIVALRRRDAGPPSRAAAAFLDAFRERNGA